MEPLPSLAVRSNSINFSAGVLKNGLMRLPCSLGLAPFQNMFHADGIQDANVIVFYRIVDLLSYSP